MDSSFSDYSSDLQELLAGYVLDDLSVEERARVEQLLAEHPELSSEVQALRETLDLMPQALPTPALPPGLRDRLLQSAASDRPPVSIAPPRHPRPLLLWGGGAIAAAVCFALAVDNLRLRHHLYEANAVIDVLRQPNPRFYILAGTEQTPAASANLIVTPDPEEVVISVNNLPELPTDQTYRLWAVLDGQTDPTYCGQFNSEDSGAAIARWQSPALECSDPNAQMLITAERATDPPIPAGDLVLRSL
jgi:anti-sigma-K factor RskA